MRADLTGRVALVTGASSGMGEASALAMAAAGARVAAAGRDAERLEALRARIVAAGGEAVALQADLADADEAVALVDRAAEALGPVDAVVHSAGAFIPQAFAETTPDALDAHWRVNVRSPFLLTQRAAAQMPEGGTVVFISSTVAHRGFGGFGAYTASKGAVESLARALAAELAPRVRVNVLTPGFVETPMVTTQYDADPAMQGVLRTKTPVGFVGAAQDMANAVVFLSSDLSRYVSGAGLVADGGWIAQGWQS